MRFIGWICALVLLAGTATSAFAADCIPQSEMADIARHFTQFRNLANADYCLNDSETSHLLEGIMFMRKTRYAPSMPRSADELFSGTFANNWYDYFIGRISDISVESGCQPGVGAFVYMWGNTMYVCPMLLSTNFTALDRASVMMHEARHIDGFPHTTCRSGPRAGLNGACDRRISEGGSYAVTVETYAQVAAYAPDVHPAIRAYARSSAVIYADEAFDQTVRVNRTSQFIAMTESRDFYVISADGSYKAEKRGASPALGQIVMRAQHMILYPDDKTLQAKYVFANNEGDIAQTAGTFAVEYNQSTPAQRAELVGMHVGAQWGARVYQGRIYFTCDPSSTSGRDVSLNGQVASSVLYPNGYDRAARSSHLITASGSILEFGCERNSPFVRASNLVFDQPYKRIYKAGTKVLGLNAGGQLFEINGTQGTLLPLEINGQIHELAPNQSYEFFDAGA